jgi:hypothetical protein
MSFHRFCKEEVRALKTDIPLQVETDCESTRIGIGVTCGGLFA